MSLFVVMGMGNRDSLSLRLSGVGSGRVVFVIIGFRLSSEFIFICEVKIFEGELIFIDYEFVLIYG